jgi:hypothetical protein
MTTKAKYSCGYEVTIPGPGEMVYSDNHYNNPKPVAPSKNTILICSALCAVPVLIGVFIGYNIASNQSANQVKAAELKVQTAQAEAALNAAKIQRIQACIEEVQ